MVVENPTLYISKKFRLVHRTFLAVFRKLLIFCAITTLTVLLNGCQSSAVKPSQMKTAADYLTDQQMLDVVEISEQALSTVTGLQLPVTPNIHIVSRSDLKSRLLVKMFDVNSSQEEQDEVLREVDLYTGAVGAVYSNKENAIYILPESIKIDGSIEVKAKKEAYYWLLVTITHELAHALQHSQVNLEYLKLSSESEEAERALRMTIEGHAELLTAQVLKQIGLIDNIEDYGSAEETDAELYNLTEAEQAYRVSFHRIYWQGKRFFDYLYHKGGNQLAWDKLSEPPLTVSAIENNLIQ